MTTASAPESRKQSREVRERLHAEARAEGGGAFRAGVADADKLRFGNCCSAAA